MNTLNITGIGVLLKTTDDCYLFQERDNKIKRNPGRITPFGGGIKKNETLVECAIRELEEEISLKVSPQDLKEIKVFESHYSPGTFIKLFLVINVNLENLTLHEGQQIIKMNIKQALNNSKVTNFTKEVLLYARDSELL